jgi:hypothetical protein
MEAGRASVVIELISGLTDYALTQVPGVPLLSIPIREAHIDIVFSTLTMWGPTFSGDGSQPVGTRFSYPMLPGDRSRTNAEEF